MVSVLVPAYNAEKTIKRCIDSIICQTYYNIELIVVDDGSSDETLSILSDYSKRDNRIVIKSQSNQGVASARNACLKDANGDYILYIDADDWIESNMIQRMVDLIGNADIVLCGNDNSETPDNVSFVPKVQIECWDQQKQMIEFMKHKRMTGMLWNKLIRRKIANGIWFDEKTGFGEDAQFLWQILKRSKKMIITNEILYHHVLEENSISHSNFSDKKYSAIPMWEDINKEVEKKYPELRELAIERLMCATVYSMYESRVCRYKNKEKIGHMRSIVRKNLFSFLILKGVSIKFKLYAFLVCLGV